MSNQIIQQIFEKKTAADNILYQIQENMLYQFFEEGLIQPVSMAEYLYSKPNRNSFENLTKEKIYFIRKLLNSLVKKYNQNDYVVEIFKNDTNVDVIILKHCVIKLYNKNNWNQKKEIFKVLNNNNYLEKIIEAKISDEFNFGYVVSEKLVSLINQEGNKIFEFNLDQLKENVQNALNYLHQFKILHNDASVDNTGYRPSDNSYVLFDFGLSKIVSEDNIDLLQSDFDNLNNSLSRF